MCCRYVTFCKYHKSGRLEASVSFVYKKIHPVSGFTFFSKIALSWQLFAIDGEALEGPAIQNLGQMREKEE
jgi:hypothetical protein